MKKKESHWAHTLTGRNHIHRGTTQSPLGDPTHNTAGESTVTHTRSRGSGSQRQVTPPPSQEPVGTRTSRHTDAGTRPDATTDSHRTTRTPATVATRPRRSRHARLRTEAPKPRHPNPRAPSTTSPWTLQPTRHDVQQPTMRQTTTTHAPVLTARQHTAADRKANMGPDWSPAAASHHHHHCHTHTPAHTHVLRSTCGGRWRGRTRRTRPWRSTWPGTSTATTGWSRQSTPSTCARAARRP